MAPPKRIRFSGLGGTGASAGACSYAFAVFLCACISWHSNGRGISAFAFSQSGIHHHYNSQASSSSLASSPVGDFGELTSALATLDQQWQIEQQASKGNGKPRWSKLVLPKEIHEDNEGGFSVDSNNSDDDYVWMLEPPNNSIPSCVVVFTGGAGLGQFPQVAYNELLSEISNRLNAVCLTAPYEVGLDHFALSKQTGERLRRGLLVLEKNRADEGLGLGASSGGGSGSSLPTYSLAHSLGCKLQTIYLAATGLETSFDGVGFLAYNNFSFARTISMGRSFAQELRGSNGGMGGMGGMGGAVNPEMINTLFDFAEMAVGAIGVEFSPTPEDTERLIQLRYNKDLQAKTRVFVFDSDTLDSSVEFEAACGSFGKTISSSDDNDDNDEDEDEGNTNSSNNNNNDTKNHDLKISNLSGGHLAPVFIQLKADDLAREAMGGFGDTVSQENIDMARDALGGFQGASFGDEEAFGGLVDEVCDWILGKPPTRPSTPLLSGNSNGSDGSGSGGGSSQ